MTSFWITFISSELSLTSDLILTDMTFVLIFLFSNLFWGLFVRRTLLISQIFNLYPRNRNIICRSTEANILPEQHKQTAYHTPVTFIEARWQEAENMFFTSHSRNIFHPALTLFFPFILFALPVFKSSSE